MADQQRVFPKEGNGALLTVAMAEELKIRKSIGVYRGHEGTVYAIDAYSKYHGTQSSSVRLNAKVSPEMDKEGSVVVVTGSHDQSILLWEVSSNSTTKPESVKMEQTRRLKGHNGDVYAIEVLQDDSFLRFGNMVSGGDYVIKTWNADTGSCNLTLQGHTGYVSCIKLRGKRVFSGSWDTTVRSWNLETGKGMHVFKGHKNIVNCIDVIDTDVFSGSWDMTIIQWSRATGEPVHIYKGHTDGVQCLQYYDDHLFSGSMDKTIRMWNIQNAKTLKVFRGHQGGIECLQVENGFCFSGSYDKTIRCFQIKTGDCVAVFEGHTDGVYCLKIFGGRMYSGSGDKSVRLWDVKDIVLYRPKSLWMKIFSCFA
ncbi:hypothetical protein HDV03_000257 [Kappamyces sp. JEL0829]|nr:hypothetical protein HDV03_000257 [Kappamyces sp. JEL0829]